jgi:ribosome recycling factor
MITHFSKDFDQCGIWLTSEYNSISAGRVHPGILDSVRIDAYGVPTLVANVASITIEDPRTLRVSPWDKDHTKLIEKELQDSGFPWSLVSDSAGLRVIVPQMTEDGRKKIMKHVKDIHEEARIRVRKVRGEANDVVDTALKSKEITEDEAKKYRDDVQKMVDKANQKLDEIVTLKEKDTMTV